MTKRRIVWVGVAICAALTVGLAGWYARRPHPFERLHEGMTRAEVKGIIGGWPWKSMNTTVHGAGALIEDYRDDAGAWVRVHSLNGQVIDVAFSEGPSLWDRLRAWIGW